jgi:prolipoprotein diacylglyceryl transferase
MFFVLLIFKKGIFANGKAKRTMFETLFINWSMNPEIFSLGPLSVRWYGLLFISGFILGWFIFKWFFQRGGVPVTLLDPLLYTLLIGTIVGARLGHCLFYQPDYYLGSWQGFWEIFMPWKGGLASHGGTIALIIAMWWFAKHYGRKYDFDFLWILDHLCIAVCFAGAFIRLGNLCNSEIYGDVTTLPWGFIFELRGETEPKHPTQLYEALSYAVLGLVLLLLYKYRAKKMYRGTFIGVFFIVLFGMRFLIEFIKEPQVGFEENMVLNMGQLLSIPFILLGVGILVYALVRKQPALIVHPEKPKAKPTHYARSLAK